MFKTTLMAAALAALWQTAAPAHAAPPTTAADARADRAEERQRQNLYKAWFPDLATARQAAVSLHDSLLETEYARGWQIFELDADSVALLQRAGYRLEPATDFIRRRNKFLDALDAADARRQAANPKAAAVGINSIPGYSCYETVEETFAAAQTMASTRPDLATWTDIGDSWQKTTGRGGYDMGVLKLTNSATDTTAGPKPKLFVTSAIHAREYVTAPVSLAFAQWLFNGYGSDPEATWLLDNHEIHLLLQTNPDGRKKAETGLSWRKNTNTAYCGPRSNSRGADLNRNFTFGWNSTNGAGSSGNQCNDTYRGPSAASEPETQAVEAYIRSLWPDRRGPGPNDAAPSDTSGIHLDLHSYADLVLWPWGTTTTPAPNSTALQTLGRRLAYFNGYTPMQSVGLYPTDGTSDGPSYGELGVAAFTIEMGNSFFQDCTSYESSVKQQNINALIYAAKVVRTPYLTPGGPEVTAVTLQTPSVAAGTPVGLSATLTDSHYNQSNGTQPVQAIASAEAYIDVPPWRPGALPIPLTPADGAFDTPTENAAATLSTAGLASGRHLVYVRGTDASGQAGPFTAAFLDITGAPPPNITLALTGSRARLLAWNIDLAWGGASGANVDLYLNGALLGSTANDGAYRDQRGKGTWRYKVCQTGSTSACSAEQSITF
jgi:hypothetical protein